MRRAVLVVGAMTLALLLASGMALAVNKIGTDGPDILRGTNRADNLYGKGGNDGLLSLGGADNLLGGAGKDAIWAGNEERLLGGDKNLNGGPGNDRVIAGQGADNALGGGGNDLMFDGEFRESSHDRFSGGTGNDVLFVEHVPAFKDTVSCGRGFDRILADRKDVVAPDCEKVRIVHGTFREVAHQDELFFESIPRSFFRGLAPFPFE